MIASELQSIIRQANELYRVGDSGMSDQEYESLIDQLKMLISHNEFEAFMASLHEKSGKVTHPFIMGSLNKFKADEPENLIKWLGKFVNGDKLSISAKIDGISCRLHYENGKLISATTRGDGYKGEDLTDKIKYVNLIPKQIDNHDTIDIRGELVILKSDFETINTQFKNARNATAGILGQKIPNAYLTSKISFIAYEIMGGVIPKGKQFNMLANLGFTTAWNIEYDVNDNITADLIKYAETKYDYDCDGLVLSSVNYTAEDKYRPDAQVAFKTNQMIGVTDIIGFEWRGPSKTGKLVPVAKIDPIFLGGSTISNVTCHNVDFIISMGLKIGSKVKVCRSGDVIPKILGLA